MAGSKSLPDEMAAHVQREFLSLIAREFTGPDGERWSQTRIGDALGGVSQTQVSEAMNGKNIGTGFLIALSKRTGQTINELLGIAEPVEGADAETDLAVEGSTLGERLRHAIHAERHRGPGAAESALMLRYPDIFRAPGFLSTAITTGRFAKPLSSATVLKLLADFLHVNFEWLVIGTGPMRRDGRGETPFETAMFTARDWGFRADAIDAAWERNKEHAAMMSAGDAFAEIQAAAAHLDRLGVPKPEQQIETKSKQRKLSRIKSKKARVEAHAKSQRETKDARPELAAPRASAVGSGDK